MTDSSIYGMAQMRVLTSCQNEDRFRLPLFPVGEASFIKVENEFGRDKRNQGLTEGEVAIQI
jgi:hypothetical protein